MNIPPLADIQEQAHVVSLPLRVRFRGVREREALVFPGPSGWGEFSPDVNPALPTHVDDEDLDVPPAPAGLATQRLFVADITPQRTLIDGHLSTELLAPENDRLEEFAAEPKRRDYWLARLADAWEVLNRTHNLGKS